MKEGGKVNWLAVIYQFQKAYAMAHATSNENNSLQKQSGTSEQAGSVKTCTMDPCPMKEKGQKERSEKCPRCGMREKQQGQKKGDPLL